jgi:OOP family OmpA-OmpF porin
MKLIRSAFFPALILCALIALQACKAKKKIVKPVAAVDTPIHPPANAPLPVQKPMAETVPPPPQEPAPKPDYNFSNIQFEFNSGILKTSSYALLDKAATQMKIDPSAKFTLSGYASAEGTADHNLQLSVDRANAVKSYLVNSGVNGDNLIAKGYGESNPVADNNTDAGRVINRRVEIRKQ